MTDWIIGIGLLLAMVLIFLVAFLRRRQDLTQIDIWRSLAQRTGLTYSVKLSNIGGYRSPHVQGTYRNRSISFGGFNPYDGEHYGYLTPETPLISISVNNKTGFAFSLDFQEHSLKTTPPDFFETIKRSVLRDDTSGEAVFPNYRPKIVLSDNEILCWQNGVITDLDEQVRLLDLLCDLAELVESSAG